MSAQLDALPRFRRMQPDDLAAVGSIERAVYAHPWTPGNFTDSLHTGYHCWVMACGGTITGYSVMMVAAGDAHLLNLSVAADWQRRGLGSALLRWMLKLAQDERAQAVYLEVRASNTAGQALYAQHGFAEIGSRRGYYPAGALREDAVTMKKNL